jgi:tripartite-type tricarboxylate transporter receptor subunit TctC
MAADIPGAPFIPEWLILEWQKRSWDCQPKETMMRRFRLMEETMMRQAWKLSCETVMLVAITLALVAAPAHAAWEPTKPVELIVPAGAGGASDQMARAIQGIILKYKLLKQPVMIFNKGGASGAEGAMDVRESKGDPHKLLVAFSLIYTLPIAQNLPLSWDNFNPVAMIALDDFILWVHSDAPYKTAKEYMDAIKAAPDNSFKGGGTGSKREDQIITAAFEKIVGKKITYIPYSSGNEAAVQLAGKHIASNVNNPSENVAQWRAGAARPLCVFSDKPMEYKKKVTADMAWSDIPTCKSQGIDVQYLMLRAFFLPPGTTKEQAAFYADLLKQVVSKPEWMEYTESNALSRHYATGDEFVDFLKKDMALHVKLMTEAGFAAKK